MKKFIICILTFCVLFSISVCAFSFPLSVYVNGQRMTFPDAQPFIDNNNRTMVPVRFVSEALDAKVEWDDALRQVTITRNKDKIILTINSNEMFVNGKMEVLDCTPVIVNDRTFVPVRFVSEALKADVKWDGTVNSVYITRNPQKEMEIPTVNEITGNGISVSINENDRVSYRENCTEILKASTLEVEYYTKGDVLIKTSYKKGVDFRKNDPARKEMSDMLSQICSEEAVGGIQSFIIMTMSYPTVIDREMVEGGYKIFFRSTAETLSMEISRIS